MATVALFEDSNWLNFAPITLTRPTFDIKVGAKSYFEECLRAPDFLLTREYLAGTVRQRHPECLVNPHSADEDTIFVNGLLHPGSISLDRFAGTRYTFAITYEGRLLVGRLSRKAREYLSACVAGGRRINLKKLEVQKSTELGMQDPKGLLSDPWDLILNLENSLSLQVADPGPGPTDVPSGVKVLGSGRVVIGEGAQIEDGTVLDTTKGGIYIGSQARISPSRITGPTYIDSLTQVKQFSIIETSYLGFNCRISGEVEHSVVMDHTNKAHSGFLGHSYVGEWVNIGAMSTTSDLKMTYGNVKMDDGSGKKIDSGTNKLGSFFGDMCKTSIGTLIYSGRRIGVSSHLHGLVSHDVPSFTIYGSTIGSSNVELELKSAIETQRKVMSRRNQKMSKAHEELIESVFLLTAEQRKKKRIRRGKFSI